MTPDPPGVKSLQVFDLLGPTTPSIANFIPNSTGRQDYWYETSGRASCR